MTYLSESRAASEPERLLRVRTLVNGDPGALDELLAMRLDPSWTVRREVVAALGHLGDAALPALCRSLVRERDDETRIAATVDALVASRGDVEAALKALASSAEAVVLADVAQILGRRHSQTSLQTLALLVEHVDDNVSVAAIEALGRIGGRGVVDVLVKAVESRRFFRCFAAIDVLGKSGDPRAIAPLVGLLDNPQYGFEAMRALGRTGDRAAVGPLCRLLAASSDGVVRAVAQALADLRQRYGERLGTTLPIEEALRRAAPSGAARRLMHCMNGADVSEQVAIVEALGCLHEDSATPTLLHALDAAPAVAATAAKVLKQLASSSETQWIEALRLGNSLRRQAILPIISRTNALEAVLECLSDESATVRRLACEALTSLGRPEATPILFERLHDRSPAVVQAAISAISALGSSDTLALATAAAAANAPAVRRAALRILSYTGRPEALSVFESGTRDADVRVRDAAIHGLSLIETPRAVDLLLELTHDASAATRASAVRALGGTNTDVQVIEQLLQALQDGDPWVRYYACQSLGKLGDVAAVPAVVERLADVAGQVRVAAIEALSRLGGERAFQALGEAATSSDVDQRRAALVGLGLSSTDRAVPLLLPHAESDDVATRLIAISALANFQTPATLEVLGRALYDADENVRAAAIGLLGKRSSTEATLLLTALLRDPTNAERAYAALCQPQAERVAGLCTALYAADDEHAIQLTHILARLNQADATAALFEALTVDNPAARKAAATTLAAVGGHEARTALRRLAKEDPDAEVRRVCHLLLAQ